MHLFQSKCDLLQLLIKILIWDVAGD